MAFNRFSNIKNSTIARSVGVYTFTNFFGKAVSFLLLFIYTNPKYISPSENGLLSLMSNALSFIMPFVAMGALQSVSTDFFKLNKNEFRNFFTTSFIMPVAVTLICFAGLFIFKDELKVNYGFPSSFVWALPLIVFCTFCYEHLINLIRNNQEPNTFLGVVLSKTFIELGLSVVLVVFYAYRWQGRLVGIIAGFGFALVYAIYYFKSKGYVFGKIESKYMRSELVYAVPIIIMQASLFCLNSSDKFFLAHFTNDNNATVGVYSIGYVFASLVFILSTALLQYVHPKIYSFLANTEIDYKAIKKHFIFFVAVMAGGTILIIVASPILYHYFIHQKYHEALGYIYILCIGNFLWSVNFFFYAFILFYKQKRRIVSISILSIIISLLCNYFLIKNGMAMGAALATVLSYLLVLITTITINREYVKKIMYA